MGPAKCGIVSKWITLWLCLLIGLSACGSGRLTILSLSLENEENTSIERGLAFAVDELNSRDGLGGIPVQLTSRILPASSQKLRSTILTKLSHSGASVLISGSRRLSAILLDLSAEIRIPVISLTSLPDNGDERRDWFFMNTISPREEARVIWQLISRLSPKGAFILSDNHPWEDEVKRELIAWARLEGRPEVLTLLPQDATPPGPSGQNAFVLLKPTTALPALIRTLRTWGNTIPLITTSRALQPSFRRLPEAEGLVCPATAIHDHFSSLTRRIADIYQSRFGHEMPLEAALAYDSIMLVATALKTATPSPNNLRLALTSELVYSSIFGTRFLSQGARYSSPAMIPVMIHLGEAEPVSTPLPGVQP